MAGIEIYVKNEQEKEQLIKEYLAPDDIYLKALDTLKENMISQGVDLDTREGKKKFILAVRELNARFGTELHKELP